MIYICTFTSAITQHLASQISASLLSAHLYSQLIPCEPNGAIGRMNWPKSFHFLNWGHVWQKIVIKTSDFLKQLTELPDWGKDQIRKDESGSMISLRSQLNLQRGPARPATTGKKPRPPQRSYCCPDAIWNHLMEQENMSGWSPFLQTYIPTRGTPGRQDSSSGQKA